MAEAPSPPSGRLKRIAVALAIAIAASLILVYVTDDQRKSLIKRGDFPGFYVLAEIKKRGLESRLYDPELQRSIENSHWPSFNGGFYMSVYPAYTAAILYPLAFFEPQAAQFIFIAINLIALIATFYIVAYFNPQFKKNFFANTIFALCFAPLFFALFGAQNTCISMALYAAACFFLSKDSKSGDYLAGVCAGIWLFKPQFAVFLIALLIVAARWRALISSLGVALIFQWLAAADHGFFWFIDWIKALGVFSYQNFISNAQQIASISGTVKAAAFYLGYSATDRFTQTATMLASAAAVFITVKFLISLRSVSRRDSRREQVRYFLGFGPLLVLVSPQTLFYDLGIGLFSYLVFADFSRREAYRELLLLNIAALAAVMLRDDLPFPVFFLFALWFAGRSLWGGRFKSLPIAEPR